jgi:hypothetical protein
MGTGLAYYHAIGTYSVHVQSSVQYMYMYSWAQPILGCISRFGRFAGIAEIISEIVNLGVNLGSSGYFPMLRLLTVQYSTAVCPVVAAPLGWSVGVSFRELERAFEVRVGAGSRDAVVGFHVSRKVLRTSIEPSI